MYFSVVGIILLIFIPTVYVQNQGVNKDQISAWDGQFLGEKCVWLETKEIGVCKLIKDCDWAQKSLRLNKKPQICSYTLNEPIVCCPNNKNKTYTACLKYNALKRLPPNRPDKYGNRVYPSYGGINSLPQEFPHMAALGYGPRENIEYYCGGSLISDKFVLSAAHCSEHSELGPVKYVRLGDLNLTSTKDDNFVQNFDVVKLYSHPGYVAAFHYNDIMVIELNGTIKITSYVRPACLSTLLPKPENFVSYTQTGWGQTSFLGKQSSHLLKIFINLVPYQRCADYYKSDPKLPNGLRDDIILCAGNKEGHDACPGDSGGPLQINFWDKDQWISYHIIVGVTSFGKGCGFKDSKGGYTRVAPYIPWIENIVWKDE